MRRRDLLIVLFVLCIGMLSSVPSVAQVRANAVILAELQEWQDAMLEEMEQALRPKKPLTILEVDYDREENTVTYATYVRAVLGEDDGDGGLRIDLVCRMTPYPDGSGIVRMWSDSDNARYRVAWDPVAYNDAVAASVRQQARAYFTALRRELNRD